jgi:hypothetical protein
METQMRRLALLIGSMTLVAASGFPSAYAQPGASSTGSGDIAAASSAKPSKAERKAARKQARAKRDAELKKLQANGYQPGKNDESTYPSDLQNAQKKAGAGQGASQ